MELHSCFQYSNPNVRERIQWSYMYVYYRENFSKDPEGVQHFPVGSSFFQGGVQILISIEPHIACDFPGVGGSGPPIPPIYPHLNTEAVILIATAF